MKIILFANFNNKNAHSHEEEIQQALEDLGHTVTPFNEKDFNNETVSKRSVKEDLIEKSTQADLLLFFKGGVQSGLTIEELADLLSKINCRKAFWFFDKVWKGRREFIYLIAQQVDYGFLNDGTFIRRHNYANLRELHQGISKQRIHKGKKQPEYDSEIAFVGQLYDKRQEWGVAMRRRYGDKFKVYNGIWDDDLNDLIASHKIIIAPYFPNTDHYWSNRVYHTLGRGGFLIHFDLDGLHKEFEDGKHLVMYKNPREMFQKIDYYLEHDKERKKIAKKGQQQVKKHFTWEHRLKELLSYF